MELITIVLILIADQGTKWLITHSSSIPMEIIPKLLYLSNVRNEGAAWSILEGQSKLLIAIAAIAIVFLGYLASSEYRKHNRTASIAYSLMLAGALGNVIDRVWLGYVRDFIETYPFGHPFPVFNVADIALTLGVGLLLYLTIFEKRGA